MLSIWFGWSTPRPVDLSPKLKRLVPGGVRQAAKKVGDVLPDVPAPPGTAWHAEEEADGRGPAESQPSDGSATDEDTTG